MEKVQVFKSSKFIGNTPVRGKEPQISFVLSKKGETHIIEGYRNLLGQDGNEEKSLFENLCKPILYWGLNDDQIIEKEDYEVVYGTPGVRLRFV